MVKYKLIKEYPGSLKLGTEILSNDMEYVGNYPEFWEKIVEKEYEILSISTNSYFGITTSQVDIKAYTKSPEFLNKWYKWSIHSVKRLSDGEIFTIGDQVKTESGINFKIKSFEIDENYLIGIGVYANKEIWSGYPNCCLSYINKSKKEILFTTEDGVDIYDGDEFFRVWYKDLTIYPYQTFANKGYAFTLLEKSAAHFSTQKAAEEYIIFNKPCLSINDLKNNFDYFGSRGNNEIKLKGLVKKKL